MKIKQQSLVISVLLMFLSGYVGFLFGKTSELETRKFVTNKEIFIEALDSVMNYSDYFLVDWEKLGKTEHSLYRCTGPDFDKYDLFSRYYPSPCDTYDLLTRAKSDFHRLTTKARVLGTNEIVNALDEVEMGFDEVSDIYFTREYYLRAFGDAYQEVMPKKFENLEKVFRDEINKSWY